MRMFALQAVLTISTILAAIGGFYLLVQLLATLLPCFHNLAADMSFEDAGRIFLICGLVSLGSGYLFKKFI
jgi:hypothetical protein